MGSLRVRVSRPISRPLSHPLTHSLGGLGVALDPLQSLITSLFNSNEQGAFYIPKPIVLGTQSLFQDSAGTVPVTADGDPVGLMIDQSGNTNPATQSVSADRTTYKIAGGIESLTYDGITDFISNRSDFKYQQFTCSLWVKSDAGQKSYANIIDVNHGTNLGWAIERSGANSYYFYLNGPGAEFTLTPDVWNNITLTADSVADVKKVYINGSEVNSEPRGNITYKSSSNLYLVTWGQKSGREWKGEMGEVILVKKVLTPTEVQQVFDASRNRYGV